MKLSKQTDHELQECWMMIFTWNMLYKLEEAIFKSHFPYKYNEYASHNPTLSNYLYSL